MARAQEEDFLMSMRFHVVTDADYALGGQASAGFMSVSSPEVTTEAVLYKEGHYAFPRKYPGSTTVSDVTLQRGVAKTDGSFWAWMYRVITGRGEYRASVTIQHFDRLALRHANATSPDAKGDFFDELDKSQPAAKSYLLKNAFPIRYKVASDFDATSSEVSIAELDLAYEYFVVTPAPTL